MKAHFRAVACLSILGLGLVELACDPQQMVNQYFKKLGLNPLAVVRDDMKPGALILKKGGFAVFNDSVFDYGKNGSSEPNVNTDDLTSKFQAILKQHEEDKSIDASLALGFVKALLPVSIDADLGLTGNVSIELINAKSS